VADLVTHLCTALLPGALLRSRITPVVAFGTVLPDLFGRAVPLALERLYDRGWPVPPELLWPWSALHEPVGWALVSALGCTLFVEKQRKRVLGALCLGGALHTGLDVLQDHHGEGYLLLAPFSARDFELGLIGSEATVALAGPLAFVTACAWLPGVIEWAVGAPRRPGPWLLAALGAGAVSGWAGSGAGLAGAWAFAASSAPWWRERPRSFALAAVLSLAVAMLIIWAR
jgi:hypothetical protein